ncbi:MAG TPA: sulfatase-like hydrolase/transferase, partial [Bryobacteraceae bacterium]|nr:sulfatase-like hydrolase/transferase [Bryobacteraceae bacterium]
MTSIAFPALFTGRRVYDVSPNGSDDLYLSFGKGHERVSWKQQPSIFTAAHRRGFNSSLVGWHHPYCRVFGASVADCFWTPNVDALTSLRREISISRQGARLLLPGRDVMPIAHQYRTVSREQQDEYRRTLEHASAVVANPDLHLIVLHWLVPHPPGIYDRHRNRLEIRQGSNYFDNLELVDVTLGTVRRALEAAGLWDQTTLIVTGDHPLRLKVWEHRPVWTTEEARLTARRQDPRVPFLVKLPHRSDPLTYGSPFDTVLLHGLILSWLDGKRSTAPEVVSFIEANRKSFRVHGADPNEFGKRLLH